MWIESHQELGRHPKTRRAARLLGVSHVTIVGHMHFLWWWSLDYAQDGDLSRYSAAEIAEAAEWEGDPEQFVRALVGAGFLDADNAPDSDALDLHDWEQYAGKLLDQRRANADKQKRWRDRHKNQDVTDPNGNVTVTLPTRNGATVPNSTVPNLTTTIGARSDSEVDESGAVAPPAKVPTPIERAPRSERGTRIPADFPLTDEMRRWARDNVPDVEVDYAHAEFCSYWRGEGGKKIDWRATWENGMYKKQEWAKTSRPRHMTQSDHNAGGRGKLVL